eukprot:TRINITY_DN2345_c0_g1_i1.p1 TRINITY_DN2345_c0_g1~~TRINITY_DN2345_c0_g1_i1.p1  ORF type:complete len:177 (-),score=33.32 TRINITY_DN2345_c0_g1_i1:431-961(-)
MDQRTAVWLYVYDRMPENKYISWLGVGVYHSGVVVYNREYSFGGHDGEESGIFVLEPGTAYGLEVKERRILGTTKLTEKEVYALVREMGRTWKGNTYHILRRNCNSFCTEFSQRLLSKDVVPSFVNRLARIGDGLSCLLPTSWLDALGGGMPEEDQMEPEQESGRLFKGTARRLDG